MRGRDHESEGKKRKKKKTRTLHNFRRREDEKGKKNSEACVRLDCESEAYS